MSAESQLNEALLADPALIAVVDSRIYPDFIAQEIQPPAVVYQRTGTEPITTIHNAIVLGTRVLFEISCLQTTRLAAEDLADLVEGALESASLEVPPLNVIMVDRRPEYEPENERYLSVVVCALWPD